MDGLRRLLPSLRSVISPPAAGNKLVWKVNRLAPMSNWTEPAFDDTGWEAADTPAGGELWLRRIIDLAMLPEEPPVFVVRNARTLQVFLNGRRVPGELIRRKGDFAVILSDRKLLARLRPGPNLVAIHAREIKATHPIEVDAFERPREEQTISPGPASAPENGKGSAP